MLPENDVGYKILFLHGLEGSNTGQKATYLKDQWSALTPKLRTTNLLELKEKKRNKPWSDIPDKQLEKAMADSLNDARDAVSYSEPDIIVGSSMSGALLMKMILEGSVDPVKTTCIFLAPAISELARLENVPSIPGSIWVLGELDDIVDNNKNLKYCQLSGGSIIYSPRDTHRLSKCLSSGLLECVMTTAIELRHLYSI